MTEIKAQLNNLRIAPRKVRLVAGLVRGLDAEPALTQLKFSPKDAALPVAKLIESALANAVENHQLKKDNLFVKEIKAGESFTVSLEKGTDTEATQSATRAIEFNWLIVDQEN